MHEAMDTPTAFPGFPSEPRSEGGAGWGGAAHHPVWIDPASPSSRRRCQRESGKERPAHKTPSNTHVSSPATTNYSGESHANDPTTNRHSHDGPHGHRTPHPDPNGQNGGPDNGCWGRLDGGFLAHHLGMGAGSSRAVGPRPGGFPLARSPANPPPAIATWQRAGYREPEQQEGR